MTQEVGALSKVRIVDLTDERAIYGAKLLADLGADVVRPEPPEGERCDCEGHSARTIRTNLHYGMLSLLRIDALFHWILKRKWVWIN